MLGEEQIRVGKKGKCEMIPFKKKKRKKNLLMDKAEATLHNKCTFIYCVSSVKYT